MPEMDDSLGSGGVVKKKKSSSGCLIIKKKGDFSGSGVGPSVSSSTTNKEFGSDDEPLENSRGNFNEKVSNEPIVYSRRAQEISDRKRSRIDLFEFDEYDEFDMKRMNNDYMKMIERSGGVSEFGSGSRAAMVEKRKRAYFDGLVSRKSGKIKSTDHGGRRREDSDSDEADFQPSDLRLKSEESAGAIRLHGKSGVLKVMMNKKKMDSPSVKKIDHQQVENKKQFQTKHEHDNKKKISIPSPGSSDSERSDRKVEMFKGDESSMKLKKTKVGKHMKSENVGRDITEIKFHKSQLNKSKISANSRSDWSERSSLPDSGSIKASKREENKSLRPENITPVKIRERKSDEKVPKEGGEEKYKRVGSTEKQLVREKIREMLINAGWKIDYRPRKGRDYLDAVYINPSGTAYWSVLKAYDAFQKQMPELDDLNKPEGESSSFSPLPDDLLKKLTRKTRRKMEKEMKKNSADKKGGFSGVSNKSTDDHSFIRKNGKAKKLKLHEEDSDSEHELSNDSAYNGGALTSSDAMKARKFRKMGRCTLLARNPDEAQNMESDGYLAYTGKRTLLAWLIDSETVQLSEKVKYMNRKRTRIKLEGWITREGIHCCCCSKILTVSKFEVHAGSKLPQPFQNIILESGLSLLECLINSWNKQDESIRKDFNLLEVTADPDDDTCGICADGGDLICCDGCPSTFHLSCLEIKMLPAGDWHCPNCTCKFCGTVQIIPLNLSASELLTCSLCEKKYHKSCGEGVTDQTETSDCVSSYCGKNCQEIHDRLQKINGVKHELQEGLSWSLLRRTDLSSDTENSGYSRRVECNSKLAIAISIMSECFLPIIDRRTGINQIHNVVYNCGSNFNRLNYHGFYTVVLERGDEIISAASVRFRGTQLAEMPFIGTCNLYRRQGMCRQLLSAVESVLCSLKIEKLVIPAISEHTQTWIDVFGFKPLEDSQRKELKSLNMLVFPGVDMLQKSLVKLECSEMVTVLNKSSPKLETPDIDSSEEETKVLVDVASHSLKPKSRSPSMDASVDSLRFGVSSPSHLVRDDGQSSAKDSADCSAIVESPVKRQDVENSSLIDAKYELQSPAETSHDINDENSSLKLSNERQVHEAEEDSAPIEPRQRSFLEASVSNGIEQASQTTNSCSNSTFEKITDAENQVSAADSRFVFDEKSDISTVDHNLKKIEVSENEGDGNLSVSLAGGSNQQPSIEVVSSVAISEEDVFVEIVADEIRMELSE